LNYLASVLIDQTDCNHGAKSASQKLTQRIDHLIRPIVSYAWADRPDATLNSGVVIRITDIGGSAGSRWISNETYWKPESGRVVLVSSAVPISVTASGASATEYSFVDILVPQYAMGVNGRIEVFMTWSWATGTTRRTRLRWGGSTFSTGDTLHDRTSTGANLSFIGITGLQNRNSLSSQVGLLSTGNLTLAGDVNQAIPTFTRATTGDHHLFITAHADTGAAMKLESYRVELIVP